tara:strand:- start:214 stop:810 length:597 start_codon:yes stop_codon:yes gene_type:complete
MTLLVGITGGIGSGKSTLSNQLLKKKLKLFDSDKVVSLLYSKPPASFLKHLKLIGLDEAVKGKKINKKSISNIIFDDFEIKTQLQNFIFKYVRKQRLIFIQKEKRKKTKIIFFDIPLLFENRLEKQFDILISIISSKKNRFQRLKKHKKMKKKLFVKIINSQTTDVTRKAKSDIVIYNNSTMEDYLKKINITINNFGL